MIGEILVGTLLAVTPESVDPPIGVLVVVADRQHTGDTVYRREPQQLTSYWIEVDSSHAVRPVTLPGLVIPAGGRFLRFSVQRTCTELADVAEERPTIDNHDCQESLVEWPMGASASPLSAPPWHGDENGPCHFSQLYVTFASPAVISLQEHRGASELCEPRPWSWSERGVVRRVDNLAEVSLDWFLGDCGARAYAISAKGPFVGDDERPCEALPDNTSAWYIKRDHSKWVPVLKQQGMSAACIIEIPIKVELPPVLIGFADPPLRWAAVRKLFPDASEAHGSPYGSGGFMVVSGSKSVVVSRSNGQIICSLPAGSIVSVQWALGSAIESWRKALIGK